MMRDWCFFLYLLCFTSLLFLSASASIVDQCRGWLRVPFIGRCRAGCFHISLPLVAFQGIAVYRHCCKGLTKQLPTQAKKGVRPIQYVDRPFRVNQYNVLEPLSVLLALA